RQYPAFACGPYADHRRRAPRARVLEEPAGARDVSRRRLRCRRLDRRAQEEGRNAGARAVRTDGDKSKSGAGGGRGPAAAIRRRRRRHAYVPLGVTKAVKCLMLTLRRTRAYSPGHLSICSPWLRPLQVPPRRRLDVFRKTVFLSHLRTCALATALSIVAG